MTVRPTAAVHAPTTIVGREVARIGFAGLHLAGPAGWGAPLDRAEAVRLLRSAVDAGVGYIDTADTLGPGVSESVIGEALHPYSDDIVVATKAGMTRAGLRAWGVLGRPDYLKQQAYASALRLRLDAIPLFFLHRIDPGVPLADQLGALIELRDEGVIREIGISAVTTAQFAEARALAPIAAVQNHFNLVSRHSAGVLDEAAASSIPFIAYWTLGHGRALIDAPELAVIADAEGVTVPQLLLAWLLQRSPNLIALPGSSKQSHLAANLAALDIELTAETLTALEAFAAVSRPVPDLPPSPETPRES